MEHLRWGSVTKCFFHCLVVILAQRAENLSSESAGQEKWLALAFLTSSKRNWKNESSLQHGLSLANAKLTWRKLLDVILVLNVWAGWKYCCVESVMKKRAWPNISVLPESVGTYSHTTTDWLVPTCVPNVWWKEQIKVIMWRKSYNWFQTKDGHDFFALHT